MPIVTLVKLLQSFGYSELEPKHPEAIDADLTLVRAEALEELGAALPDPGVLDVFRIKYDYHNIKAMLKAEVMNVSPGAIVSLCVSRTVIALSHAARSASVSSNESGQRTVHAHASPSCALSSAVMTAAAPGRYNADGT